MSLRAPQQLLAILAVLFVGVPVVAIAQRGGGGAGRVSVSSQRSRFDTLDVDFKLTKDQRKTIKDILDAAHKSAAPVRDGLTKAHADIAAAIQANKTTDVDAAVQRYAEQSAAMMALEMKALADVMKALTDEQRANNAAVSEAFFLMRGAFLDSKKWDDIPTGKLY
jgi:Spy/CpxP family protein refolding chaperone